ncbi:hypothetical protein TPHA_0C00880 [Tetrapisispora phaffii CBS 4417]|uniref:Methyltransferase small domain-containing protein n=1 Tax=Tetrapisispora phaffii (strain ATCC 24235 / CBS 4417 / NBRC 1672 / NRRL Y-8282 / UCD 70-5) TaxID=1071381 RepID=G8BR68_TETPH|nr:hypothetical protein TPHA_0C00880 [Tetrapisispora phaffii CBS 4417]CCE62244.1 hypothetical protein TPHA_0C00880 [Tetrapisispora phaffii CBS 4417]
MLPTPYVTCDYEKVYEPSEDSFLLLDSLEDEQLFLKDRFKNKLTVVSEFGPGTGIVLTFMMQNHIPTMGNSLYFGLDISPWAVKTTLETAKKNDCDKSYLDCIQTDLGSNLRNNQVDVLVFNPPYVPAEKVPLVPADEKDIHTWLDLALEGGKNGMVVTQRVLDNLGNILSPDGVAYILFCAQNRPEEIVKDMIDNYSWKVELVKQRKAGWEVLSVYRFSRR